MLMIAPVSITASSAQCVDSSQVNDYTVRAVKFKSLFGRIPKDLRKLLDSHRGEPYSSDRASQYIKEIRNFYATNPAQEKYERLIANKLKLSVKAGRTWLECVEKVDPAECQSAFAGTTQCVDVTIKRYFVDVDALDSSPYLLLFPRSALTTLYGAMPRPLLALNPGLGAHQDKRLGPAASIDTATDLLDLGSLFRSAPIGSTTASVTLPTPPALQPSPVPLPSSTPDPLEVELGRAAAATAANEETPVNLEKTDTKLLLRLMGRKSLTRNFYDTSVGLTLARTKALDLFQNLALEAKFDARNLPHGSGDFLTNAAAVGFSTDLRLKTGVIKLITLGGRYRWSHNRFFSGNGTTPTEVSTENGFEGRVVLDGTLGNGLARTAVWFDGGALNGARGSFRRVAALAAYGKEFAIPRKKDFHKISPPELSQPCWTSYPDPEKPEASRKNEQTFGVEMLVGGGHAWGRIPEYARFYGGSPPGQFLYDELSAQSLTTFPSGPIIRSLAQSQAGVVTAPRNILRGGTSFWHANLSISIPIAPWSRPLIPHEWVTTSELREDDEEFAGRVPEHAVICRDLKATIKTLVGVSGVNLMVNQQSRDLLTEAEKKDLRLRNIENRTAEENDRLAAAELALTVAKARVKPELEDLFRREILPVTNFIADHANMISVKPLLMFDVAHLSLSGVHDSRTRYGAGIGLQIDIVLARFEFGYVAALNRSSGDARGHVLGRLVLKRFF